MKGILKLIKGEFTKLLKSNTLYIMTGMLIAAIVLMSVVYATQEQNVNTLMEFVVGGGPELDSFDIMDGGDNINALKDAGVDTSQLDSLAAQLNEQPRVKLLLVGVDPAILKFLSTPNNGLPQGGSTDLSAFAELAEVQGLLYNKYFYDLYNQSKFLDDLLADQTSRMDNADYRISYNDIIKSVMKELNTSYLALMGPNGAYEAYNADPNSQEKWDTVVNAMSDFEYRLEVYRHYTQANAMSTNYLLLPATNMTSDAYTTLSDGLKALNLSSVSEYKNYSSSVKDHYTVEKFKYDLMSGFNPSLPVPEKDKYPLPKKLENTTESPTEIEKQQNIAYRMLSAMEKLEFGEQAKDSLFYAYEPTILSEVKAYISGTGSASKAVTDFIARFGVKSELKNGELDYNPLLPFETAVDQSYTAEIYKSIYDEKIAPYYDNSEKAKLLELRTKLDGLLTSKSAAEIFALTTKLEPTQEEQQAATQLYNEIKSTFKEYTSRTGTVSTLVKNVSWVEAISANNLNDKQTKKIYGFLLNSRYKLNSSVTQAQFLIENNELSAKYTAPEKLTDGYGAVQFIYVLTGVIILIFGIVIAAGMIAGEHTDGTMKLLLIRPHTRSQVLLSKFLTVALVLVAFYIINFLVSLGVGAVFWGLKAPFAVLSIFNSTTAITMTPLAVLAWLHLFGLIEAIIFSLVALTISTVARSRSGAIAFSMLIYFVSFVLGALLSTYSWYKFVLFNNTNLFYYMSSTGPSIADLTLWFSVVVNIVYVVGLALACFFTFAKRDAT